MTSESLEKLWAARHDTLGRIAGHASDFHQGVWG